jgi:hypothetical protein
MDDTVESQDASVLANFYTKHFKQLALSTVLSKPSDQCNIQMINSWLGPVVWKK